MRTTIDGGGRVVIPKEIRDRLGLVPGSEVEIIEADGWAEIAPAPTPMRLVRRGDHVVAETTRPMPVLTTETVRAVVERGRR
jgi:AbrB family looped-hinge helix DNA binding protein